MTLEVAPTVRVKRDEQKGPRFDRYFGPVLDALRALGGEGKP